jgi:hypothetical protein
MLHFRKRGRRGPLLAASVVGAVCASAALALPAGATVTSTTGNHMIVGSGSVTTYNMMQAMDVLFNDSPGCTITVASTVSNPPETFVCQNKPASLTGGNTENPYNDVAVEEPGLGSSTGIAQLENQGSGGTTLSTALVNFARSSRAAKSSDPTGLNFVAYAEDGVSWFHFKDVKGVKTPSSCINSLTQKQLTEIFSPTTNAEKYWNFYVPPGSKASTSCGYKRVAGKLTPALVEQYSAQPGSGTLSTFDGYIGVKSEDYVASRGTAYEKTHIIVENEDRQIVRNGDEADAVFFFSWGKFQIECGVGDSGTLPGCSPAKGDKVQLGAINGVFATAKDILCSPASNCTGLRHPFPLPRFLYNVYSNGSNATFPAATQATLNYVSEVGFVCKPNTTVKGPILDPSTLIPYRTEIDALIKSNGFLPLPLQKTEDTGAVPHPAASLLAKSVYQMNDPYYHDTALNAGSSGRDPRGYCIVSSTG